MTIAKRKNENIHIRVELEQKETISRAAKMSGLDTSSFILQHSLKAAREELKTVESLSLSDRDSEMFLEAVSNPPLPNDNLKSAYNKYKEIFS